MMGNETAKSLNMQLLLIVAEKLSSENQGAQDGLSGGGNGMRQMR